MQGPCPGLRVGAADEVVDLGGRLRPVDRPVLRPAPALVGAGVRVLRLLGRRPLAHEVHPLQHRLHPHREEVVEVDAAQRVVRADVHLLLKQNRPRVEPVVGPEDAEAGLRRPEDDRPVDGARPLVHGEERGVVLDGPELRRVERLLGDEEGDVGHHPEVGLEPAHLLPHLGRAEGLRLEDGDPPLDGARLQGIGGAALAVRGGVDPHHVLAAVEQRLQHRAPERLLSVDDDSHGSVFLSSLYRALRAARPCGSRSRLVSLRLVDSALPGPRPRPRAADAPDGDPGPRPLVGGGRGRPGRRPRERPRRPRLVNPPLIVAEDLAQ